MNKILSTTIRRTILSGIVLFCLLGIPARAATISPVDQEVMMSVTIGAAPPPGVTTTPTPPPADNRRFSIYGYTSPGAKVVIQNSGIHSETYANAQGVFNFQYLFLTLFREDICIVAYDTDNRSTPPLCIPPPGVEDNKEIGPILLPPSTSISSGNAYVGDTVTLTGQTIPNADVKLSLFTDEMKQGKISLVPSAYAYTLPQLTLTSNKKGEYSLTLPTASSQFMRMFTRALYEGNSTPKGLTLILDIFPLWMLFIRFISTYLTLLKNHLIELVILLQLYFLLMYFLKHYFTGHEIMSHKRRALALRHDALLLVPHELATEHLELAVRSVSLIKR